MRTDGIFFGPEKKFYGGNYSTLLRQESILNLLGSGLPRLIS
jgi:hypothetical protein